jgi:hypothetical protein
VPPAKYLFPTETEPVANLQWLLIEAYRQLVATPPPLPKQELAGETFALADVANVGTAISMNNARAAIRPFMINLHVTDVVRGLLQRRGGRRPMPCSHRRDRVIGSVRKSHLTNLKPRYAPLIQMSGE